MGCGWVGAKVVGESVAGTNWVFATEITSDDVTSPYWPNRSAVKTFCGLLMRKLTNALEARESVVGKYTVEATVTLPALIPLSTT